MRLFRRGPLAAGTVLLLGVAAALGAFAGVPVASADPSGEPLTPFRIIHGATDPEEFLVPVSLEPEQSLEQVDDHHAVVRWDSEHIAFTITAEPAHDAVGTSVPTSLRVDVEKQTATLIVHHRAGNPAAAGASFEYPISPGPGREGVFQVFPAVFTPNEHQPPSSSCTVPRLKGLRLRAAKAQLQKAGCRLGTVTRGRGVGAQRARVGRQSPAPGTVAASGTPVALRLVR